MTEVITIPKNPVRVPSQDYEFLRKEGLRHIENLAHDLWTDYNTHDPGITIMEALCYAITELGYRCGFDMKDLLAGRMDDQTFYTAKNILTNNPLTINDYRKLLVDIDGIHNAWLIAEEFSKGSQNEKLAVNEVPLYADFKLDQLTKNKNDFPIFLSGLYRVLLDLDIDDEHGDLNTGDILVQNPAAGSFIEGEFMFLFELPSYENWNQSFAEKAANDSPIRITTVSITTDGQQWKCKLTLDDSSSQEFRVGIAKKPAGKMVVDSDVTAMLLPSYMQKVFFTYTKKIGKTRKIIKTATKILHEKRNLCEDFISINAIRSEEISFCFDIDVLPSADIEKVQAEAFFAIENYLNPPVDFYSLKELLVQQIPTDEIFNGPVLTHGFINTEQLEQTQLRTVIHSSDIINLLMDIEGVIAIRNFLMTKYDEDGKAVPGEIGASWCMHITHLHKPVLSVERSKIILFKNQFPFLARYDEVRDTVLLFHAQKAKDKLHNFQQDIPIPSGDIRDTESFWPVQYDLPQTYGVGVNGLPANAGLLRRVQQKQLKAYLVFYEQLLADFFSQLTNAYQLFSVKEITHTYYAQFLSNIKDMDEVYKIDGTDFLLEKVIDQPLSNSDNGNEWQQLYESKNTFEDRRNRFFDHLLARFAESFNDYAMMMYTINYEDRTEEKITFNDLATSKIETLKNYPEISSNRGRAFNYYPQLENFTIDNSRLWDTNNVSGLEKRICSLTGLTELQSRRRFLYCIKNIEVICEEKTVEENGQEKIKCFHHFFITSLGGTRMRNSIPYETKQEADKAISKVIEVGKKIDYYSYISAEKKLILGDGQQTLIETDKNAFLNKEEAMKAAAKFADELSADCNVPLGLHLIEHILLRPRNADFDLMEVCLHNGYCPCEIDPYTYRASVVLPYWPGHFDNRTFREYFENKIKEEAPAQTMLKVCWLSNNLMREFETMYKEWIESLAEYASDKNNGTITDRFKIANKDMIRKLAELHSEYPMATLHNCDESKEGSNTVVLGKTILGTIKNQ